MSNQRILIVDDDKDIRKQLVRWLARKKYLLDEAEDGRSARKKLVQSHYQLVLLDILLPDIGGFDMLSDIRQQYPDTCVIMLTGHAEADSNRRALAAGAFDFFPKPLDWSLLGEQVEAAMQQFRATQTLKRQQEEAAKQYHFGLIPGQSPVMQELLDKLERVAKTDETVLLTGEHGTGKTMLANILHYNSPRANNSLIIADCGNFEENLAHSELFGHERGAYTGAHQRRIGKAELSHEGTLLLDEIGELSASLQTKLLQFVQHKTFERLGSNQSTQVDTRLIAATNRDLELAMQEGSFREDLYYRLTRFIFRIPSLRERREDIPELARHFVLAEKGRYPHVRGISDAAMAMLASYDFPGNVRELENIIKRALVYEETDMIQPKTIAPDLTRLNRNGQLDFRDMSYRDAKGLFEKYYFQQLMAAHKGNKSRASNAAGFDRGHLREKLRKYGLDDKQNNAGESEDE